MLRLRSAGDFQRVRREGRSHAHPLAVLIACRQPEGQNLPARLGFAAGRSVGSAVQRNRAKRLLREAARAGAASLPDGWDFVFIARSGAAQAGLTEIQAAVQSLLSRFRPSLPRSPSDG